MGSTQVEELWELETPIALTNTLDVGNVLDAMVALVLEQSGNEKVRSVNVVVGETNDGYLNDIRGRHITAAQVREAWGAARSGPVTEGCVGAGTGTRCLEKKRGRESFSISAFGPDPRNWSGQRDKNVSFPS